MYTTTILRGRYVVSSPLYAVRPFPFPHSRATVVTVIAHRPGCSIRYVEQFIYLQGFLLSIFFPFLLPTGLFLISLLIGPLNQ